MSAMRDSHAHATTQAPSKARQRGPFLFRGMRCERDRSRAECRDADAVAPQRGARDPPRRVAAGSRGRKRSCRQSGVVGDGMRRRLIPLIAGEIGAEDGAARRPPGRAAPHGASGQNPVLQVLSLPGKVDALVQEPVGIDCVSLGVEFRDLGIDLSHPPLDACAELEVQHVHRRTYCPQLTSF